MKIANIGTVAERRTRRSTERESKGAGAVVGNSKSGERKRGGTGKGRVAAVAGFFSRVGDLGFSAHSG